MSGQRDLLVVWPNPDRYVGSLAVAFPELRITRACDFGEAEPYLADAEILLTHGVGLTSDMIASMRQLKWIQCLISGTDQLAEARDARPEVIVTSCRGIHGPQMSEMALLHMLALARGLLPIDRSRAARKLVEPQQRSLERKNVVIVGMGVAGMRLAAACNALDMTVYGVSRTQREIPGVKAVFLREQLVAAAREADYLVLALPHDEDSHEIVGSEVLAAMKPSSFLINIARGGVVNERALIAALRSGRIAGAGLDVTAPEPPSIESPLWDMDNVVLTPHLSGRSDRYDEQALGVILPNVERYLAGRVDQLVNLIDSPPSTAGVPA